MLTQDEVDDAGLFVLEEDLLPGLATVLAAVDTAVLARPERVADRRYVDQVRIRRMDADADSSLDRSR